MTKLDAQAVKDWFASLPFTEMQEVLGALNATLQGHKEQRRKELMAELEALGDGPTEAPRRITPATSGGRSEVKPQYKGPNGELWSGRGRSPRWLAEAEAAGRSKNDFRIVE